MDAGARGIQPRAPVGKPPFTQSQLKKGIPPHCFNRSILRSFSYLASDITILFINYYVATNYFELLPKSLTYITWCTYGFFQGCIMVGLWVIAHECGHNAFSTHPWLNDAVGLIVHSFLLYPYFSFKISHRHHHSNTNSIDKDETYVPKRKHNLELYNKLMTYPIGRFIGLFFVVIFGLTGYLTFNLYGRKYERFASHFGPYSPIFSDGERLQVIVMNGLVTVTTFLNHTHSSLPHYESSEWDWMRGSLATMDRDFGILNTLFHQGPSGHVIHHLFPSLPHYHAMEATEAVKPLLGPYYQFDEKTSIWMAFWREIRECVYVEADKELPGVLWSKNKL